MAISAPVFLAKVSGGPGQCSEGVFTYQCIDFGSHSEEHIGTQVLSSSLKSGGSLGPGGRLAHTRTAECSEELAGLMAESRARLGDQSSCHSKACHHMAACLSLPPWEAQLNKAHHQSCSLRPEVASLSPAL